MKSAGPSYKNIKIMSTANCYMKKIYFTETLFSDAYFCWAETACECDCVVTIANQCVACGDKQEALTLVFVMFLFRDEIQ